MTKYHVALSFAGEDREYVEAVAIQLRSNSVDVFYDKFEEADLWGKDLYDHLSEVYKSKALFTVMFVSSSYVEKVWTNHERRSAQPRALTESREYILPAFFDESIEVPGLLKTTGHVSLSTRTPEQFADLILKKLKQSGVRLKQQFSYSDDVKADVDYPLSRNSFSRLVKDMKSYNWYTQSPAVKASLELDWKKICPDQAFILGRNIYQCACGGERKAVSVLQGLRRELAALPIDRALDLLNGMFYEVYFDCEGEFRGQKLKARSLEELFALQSVEKFAPSVAFIRRALEPYAHELVVLPNVVPEVIEIDIVVGRTDPPLVRSIKLGEISLLTSDSTNADPEMWRLGFNAFTLDDLAKEISREWSIPIGQLKLNCKPKGERKTKYRLRDGWAVRRPGRRGHESS